MALGDIQPYGDIPAEGYGDKTQQVVAGGSAPAINAGEPVAKTLGNQYVITMATNKPVVATDFLAGISSTASTETATVDGKVQVIPIGKQLWQISAKVPATFGIGTTPNQTTYNALVGARVLIDKTAGVYTILAVDGSTNGCVVENNDVIRNPGKVVFTFRGALSYTA